VGLVVWQAGFVLADLLLRRPPFGSWHGATVLDLGCGTGASLAMSFELSYHGHACCCRC